MIKFIIQAAGYVRQYKWISLVLLFSMIFEGGLESATRFSFKYLIDDIISSRSEQRLVVLIVLMAAAAAILMGLCFLADYLWAKLGAILLNEVRQKLLSHLQTLSIGFFNATPSGDLLSRFISDACAIESSFVTVVPYLIVNLTTTIFSFAFMFAIHPLLAFLALIGLVIVIFLPRIFSRKATSANVGMRVIQGRVSSRLQEITQSQNVIKSFNLEKEFENRFREESKQLLLASTRANFLVYMAQRIPNLLFFVMALAFLGVSAGMTMRGMITLGDVISFQVLLLGLNGAITNMTFLAPIAVDGLASMERINQVLDERSDITLPARPVTAAPLRESIIFDNVRFSYASRGGEQSNIVLANLSFTITRGDFVLIAGPSGSGKTSTLLLMLRLYAPDSGKILFNEIDLAQYDPESLRAKFGVVGQDAVLFDGTIRDNIKLGKLDADDGEIWTALVHAEIADMVSQLPEGLDTRVGERGTFLSGGQRQRLALARALVRRPSVLLLDEATSALDSSAEAGLLETLKRISQESNITIVAVSHRMSFSTVANHVIVLGPGGFIDDQGTHLQLLGRKGIYADLWRSGHYDQPAQ